jgi:hypothetical protein
MGRQDYEGAPMSGVSGDVAGSTTSDYGSSGSLGQMSSGESFSGADLYGGGEAEQQIRQAVSNVRQQYMDRPQQIQNMGFGTFSDLASRGGLYNFSTPFSLEGLLGGKYSFSDLAKQSFKQHPIVQAFSFIGQNASRQLMEGLEKGYKPQYNRIGQVVATINPKTGQYGAGSVVERIDPNNPANEPVPSMDTGGDGGGFIAPEATAVAAAQPEPEVSMVDPDLRYPAGGVYPEEGLYRRMGLLDIAPTQYGGLLAGYDRPQFEAMQAGFQRPVDVGLFEDPYDVKGYTLLA